MCLYFFNLFRALICCWPKHNDAAGQRAQKGSGIFSFAHPHQDKVAHDGELVPLVNAKEQQQKQQIEPELEYDQERQVHYVSNILNNFKPLVAGGKSQVILNFNPEQEARSQGGETATTTTTTELEDFKSSSNNVDKQLLTLNIANKLTDSNGRQANSDEMGQPEKEVAKSFRVRTDQRRHLDFDQPFDLDNLTAPQRSKFSGPFHFIQAADCQFGMINSYVHHRTDFEWSEEIELCERLVSVCNQMQPKPLFMIICGDLVDSLPVASQVGQLQVLDFKRIFAKLDHSIPLVCVCGNHDVGDEPTHQTVMDYRSTFGNDYFYFTKNDILFIVINSQYYQHRANVQEEAHEQDTWLESILSKCKHFKYSIIFEHIPWFLEQPEEEDDYFNIRKEVRLGWLRKFKDAGVTKIMCGHYHRNAGGWFEGMELVVTSAIGAQCGSDKSGVRIVKVFEDSIEHQYYAMPDIPLKVELTKNNKTDIP